MRTILLAFLLVTAACSGGEADSPAAEGTKFQTDLSQASTEARAAFQVASFGEFEPYRLGKARGSFQATQTLIRKWRSGRSWP
jgi:hypothetical protein